MKLCKIRNLYLIKTKKTLLKQIYLNDILYIFAPDGLFAINETKNAVNKMYYLSSDHLGSINLIVDASNGNVVDDLSYDAWGRNRNPVNWTYSNITLSTITDRGYTSHEHLPNFGLINMNVPIKRVQSQASLSYAEREAHRGEASTYGRVYDPMTMNFLSPDPVLQNPSNSQNYNRYSYCLNNPLKYVDPSGYNYSNIDWGYSYGTGSGSQRNWKQELDWIYGRGEYSLGGGFGGLGKFYYVNGRGYQIASDGSLITGNEKDQGTRAFYRNNQYGFYAQTSGTAYYATENGRTKGFATSDVRCVWVNAGEQMPAWNDRGWRFYGMGNVFDEMSELPFVTEKNNPNYPGVTIHYEKGRRVGAYIPLYGILVGEKSYMENDKEWLQHEYGHFLQFMLKGPNYYLNNVIPQSVTSMLVNDSYHHNRIYVELEATTLAFLFFTSKGDSTLKDMPNLFTDKPIPLFHFQIENYKKRQNPIPPILWF